MWILLIFIYLFILDLLATYTILVNQFVLFDSYNNFIIIVKLVKLEDI